MTIKANANRAAEVFRKSNQTIDEKPLRDFIYTNSPLDKREGNLELKHLKWVADGDVARVEESFRKEFHTLVAEGGAYATSAVKHFEYAAVLSVSNCILAAQYAGIPSQKASAIRSYYLQNIEAVSDIQSYYNICFEVMSVITRMIQSVRAVSTGNVHVDRAREFINQNIEYPITLEDIAKEAKLSADHLSRLFRTYMGISIKQYTRQRKMEVACSLLANTTYQIADIASKLGFSSQSHFGKLFKEYFKMTPHDYRASRT